VEVPGIEPGSFAALPGLLRAQLAMPLLGPTDHASESM
jgi:site-specific DNA recombinase